MVFLLPDGCNLYIGVLVSLDLVPEQVDLVHKQGSFPLPRLLQAACALLPRVPFDKSEALGRDTAAAILHRSLLERLKFHFPYAFQLYELFANQSLESLNSLLMHVKRLSEFLLLLIQLHMQRPYV